MVKSFPRAELKDLRALLDPVTDQFIVKDVDEIQYGVWRVNLAYGLITPGDDQARRREAIINGGTC